MPICYRYPTRVELSGETISTAVSHPPISTTLAARTSVGYHKQTLAAVIAGAEPTCRNLVDSRMCRWCLPDMVFQSEAADWSYRQRYNMVSHFIPEEEASSQSSAEIDTEAASSDEEADVAADGTIVQGSSKY